MSDNGIKTFTSDPENEAQAYWLTRTAERIISGMRAYGLPSESSGKAISVSIPTMADQASVLCTPKKRRPESVLPKEKISFIN